MKHKMGLVLTPSNEHKLIKRLDRELQQPAGNRPYLTNLTKTKRVYKIRNKDHENLLHLSFKHGSKLLFWHLSGLKDYNLNAKNKKGFTVLERCFYEPGNTLEFAKWIIKSGALIRGTKSAEGLLHSPRNKTWSRNGVKEVESLLVKYGADPYARDAAGNTFFHVTCSMDVIMNMFYSGTTDPSLMNNNEMTIFDAIFDNKLYHRCWQRWSLKEMKFILEHALKLIDFETFPIQFLTLIRIANIDEEICLKIISQMDKSHCFLNNYCLLKYTSDENHKLLLVELKKCSPKTFRMFLDKFQEEMLDVLESWTFREFLSLWEGSCFGDKHAYDVESDTLQRLLQEPYQKVFINMCNDFIYAEKCTLFHLQRTFYGNRWPTEIFTGFVFNYLSYGGIVDSLMYPFLLNSSEYRTLLHFVKVEDFQQLYLILRSRIVTASLTTLQPLEDLRIIIYNRDEAIKYLRVLQNKTVISQCINQELLTDEELDRLPKVRSLVDLARDAARKAVLQNLKKRYLGNYFSTVNYLPIPQLVKEILLYEYPIYSVC